MNAFTFESKHKTFLIGAMILGLVCLVLSYFMDSEPMHVRFWSNYLHNTVFFTGIGFISMFIIAAFTTAWAGWFVGMKRVWEAMSLFLIPGLILFIPIIIGMWGHWHHLYHWADAEAVANDPVLKGKSSFLNKGWYTFGTLIIVGTWVYFAWKNRQISIAEDEEGEGVADNYAHHRRLRVYAAIFLPIAGFSSAAMIWQWVMSIDAHWYSTLFAWYSSASLFIAAMALTILLLVFLKNQGHFAHITSNHFHDMGKFVFAISVFWTYMWFSQYMLIWYANVGEETVYFRHRFDNYRALFFANLIMNFVLPFFILLRNDNKRKYGPLVFASVLVFIGHWVDYFLMIKPGARLTAIEAAAHHAHGHAGHDHGQAEHAVEAVRPVFDFAMGFNIPGLLEIGIMIGFLAGFLYFVLNQLTKASLVPKNDPYIDEALHHEVWPYPASEDGGNHHH
jgi:hypothetical protein